MWCTVWIMPTYLKGKLCADHFGGITTDIQQILTTFFLQASFHSNIYSNCWRIRVFAWRQERWRKPKSSTSGYSRYRIIILIFQFFYNWPHSFKMFKILQIWKRCWQLACKGTFLQGLWVSASNTAEVFKQISFSGRKHLAQHSTGERIVISLILTRDKSTTTFHTNLSNPMVLCFAQIHIMIFFFKECIFINMHGIFAALESPKGL